MHTITFDTYPPMFDDYDACIENDRYDDELQLFTVPEAWATQWITDHLDMPMKEFMREYTWDETFAMFDAASSQHVVISSEIVDRSTGEKVEMFPVRFMWDMDDARYTELFAVPESAVDVCNYCGAVFFGDLKLEFIRNDISGIYCNVFQYGAEDISENAYGYLSDGTPYEERNPLADEIIPTQCNSFAEFAADIEIQVLRLLPDYPDLIPVASAQTDPDKWYPGSHPYHVNITRRISREGRK